jgi:hypothetical protein
MNLLKKLSLLLSVALLCGSAAFGQTIVPFTTLAAAVTSSSSQANTFKLTSTSGITAGNTMLFIEGEADFVNAVTTTPATVTVTRGAGPSSRVSTHPNGAVVWYGPPNYFQTATPPGWPFGSCTRSTASGGGEFGVLPYIDINNNVYSDCLGGLWVRGLSAPSPAVVFAPAPGGAVLTGVGTSTATTNTSMYCSQIYLPTNKLLTGLEILNGATTANGHRNVILYDAAGYLLAQSGTTTTSGTASQYQALPFTAQYFAVGPAWYVGCSQAQSSSDTLNLMVTADGNAGFFTQIYTGQTYGTVPTTITPPSAYTTAQGPYFAFY